MTKLGGPLSILPEDAHHLGIALRAEWNLDPPTPFERDLQAYGAAVEREGHAPGKVVAERQDSPIKFVELSDCVLHRGSDRFRYMR